MNFKRFIDPDLLNGCIVKSILFFMIPIVTSQLFQQLYNTTDTIIVGYFLHENSLAAIGACTAIFELIMNLGNGFGTGCSIVIARIFGSNDREYLKRAVAAAILLVTTVSLLLTLSCSLFLRPLLVALKTPAPILQESLSYISIISIFCGVLFAYNLCAGMLRAVGNSFMPLIFLILSSLLNVALDIVLITRCHMGVAGTAVATVIAQGISVALCVLYIIKGVKILIPSATSFRLRGSGKLYKDLIGQGLSMALMLSIVGSGTLILQSAINSFGTYIIAGHIAARKIFSLTTVVLSSMGMTIATFVSQNYGAKNIARIKKGVTIAAVMTVCYGIILTLLSPFFIRYVFEFVSGSKNPQVLDYGTRYVQFAFPFYLALGPLLVWRNALQGLGAKILPLLSSILELSGKIVFTVLLIPHLGVFGIILCEPLIWCTMAIQLVWVYASRIKKLSFSAEK
ncbi:MAG: polysaccharide biosynthesis C-terminal domain-containing protein [Treponema sp.]|nr:polysaccharide biosynthesis C-terminal domain-containing protein [Treponema sp.]